MEINIQLFEDVLSGKLKGRFVFRNQITCNSDLLTRNITDEYKFTHPYRIENWTYTPSGMYHFYGESKVDIIDFIQDTDMKENELTIEIPDGKIVDWDGSKKQNKIVLKDKQLTYEEICRSLFKNGLVYYITGHGNIDSINTQYRSDSNNATSKHQLECILAKNKLANVAKYLNDGWKPINSTEVWIIERDCCLGCHAVSIRAGSTVFNGYGLVIFKSKELAIQAIEILGEETVKLALEPLGI